MTRRVQAVRWLSCLVAVFGAAACSSGRYAHPVSPTPEPLLLEWESAQLRDHPLVGHVYDVAGARVVSREELVGALATADFVLLGEQHDNADHHTLQAQLLANLVAKGRRPTVAFEQIDLDQQSALDAAVARAAAEESVAERSQRIAKSVGWERSGWPKFEEYQPIFVEALQAGLPLRAANLSREALRSGSAAQEPVPLDASARASLAADIEESHCGYAVPTMVEAMVVAQGRRDQAMATVLLAAEADSAVLIAGFGHTRTDYGVPVDLQVRRPDLRVVSVAILEVDADAAGPVDYAEPLHAARLPFDYVVFTPRTDREDPCEKFRRSLEKMKAGAAGD